MPWEVTLHADLGIVETRYDRVLRPAELEAAVLETLRVASEAGASRFLGDCTRLTGGHSIADLYFLAQAVQNSKVAGRVREAVLLPEVQSAQRVVHFWEDAATNRGLVVEIFCDREAAVDWLLDRPPRRS